MRLNNVNPSSVIGKTVIYRGQFWRVVQTDTNQVRVDKPWNSAKGLLSLDQFRESRVYPSCEEVRKTYPRLLRALRWACILTQGEAEECVHGYLTTGSYYMGSEAVAHMGGSRAALVHAIGRRHIFQRMQRIPTKTEAAVC